MSVAREYTNAEIFARLEALPAHFRYTIERMSVYDPDPDVCMPAPPTSVAPEEVKAFYEAQERIRVEMARQQQGWSIIISTSDRWNNGPSFHGRGPTLAAAWQQVVAYIVAFSEVVQDEAPH